ncbi:MAG: hypothetical protein QXV62_06550, partial [Nitrososphaerota archaeon]
MRSLDLEARDRLLGEVEKTYGVKDYLQGYELVMAGGDRVRACTGEALEVASCLGKVVSVGVYVAKWRKWGVILSIEGAQLIGDEMATNTIELSREEAWRWMNGAPIHLKAWTGGKIVLGMYKGVFLGSAIVARNGVAYP